MKKQEFKSKTKTATSTAMAQFIMTAYQGLMLAIFLSVLISHNKAL